MERSKSSMITIVEIDLGFRPTFNNEWLKFYYFGLQSEMCLSFPLPVSRYRK